MISFVKFVKTRPAPFAQLEKLLKGRNWKTSDIEFVDKYIETKNEWDKPVYSMRLTLKDCRTFTVAFQDTHPCDCCSDWKFACVEEWS